MTEFAFIGVRTADEWAAWRDTSFNVDTSADGVRIAREETPTYVAPRVVLSDPTLDVVDVDQDDCGTLYVLAATGELYVHEGLGPDEDADETGIDGLRRLECAEDPGGWGTPRALCVTARDIYVGYRTTGTELPTGQVRAISKSLLQTRWVADHAVAPPAAEGLNERRAAFGDPVRIVDADGRVLVLDRAAGVEPDTGAGAGAGAGGETAPPDPPVTGTSGIVVGLSPEGAGRVVLEDLSDPADLARDGAGNLYVLLGGGADALFRKFVPAPDDTPDTGETPSTGDMPSSNDAPGTYVEASEGFDASAAPPDPDCVAVANEDELVVGMKPGTTAERTLFRYLPAGRRFERVSSFKRSCTRLSMGTSVDEDRVPGVFAVGGGGRTVSFLARAHRNRRNGRTGWYDGQAIGRVDAGVEATEWHRVTLTHALDGIGTQVGLSYLATDDPAARMGPDDPWTAVSLPNPTDAFLEDAVGRYLWLRIDLLGEAFDSPRVDPLRAYFPRQSYLRYLPAIYEEHSESREFLERFLSLFERAFVGIEEEIDHVTAYSDAEGIPDESLGWLEGWLGLRVDETWPEAARRELIAEAFSLFRARGTRSGLLALLGIYLRGITAESTTWERLREHDRFERAAVEAASGLTDAERERFTPPDGPAFVLEHADLDCIDDGVVMETFERFLTCPQCFLVLVRSSITEEQRRTVQRIVEAERPAHAVGRAVELHPWVHLGGHTYLGLNSVLADTDLVVGRSGLGRDAVLGDREEAAQLEVRARLGEDRL